ncbi:MAG: potassium/proton antiporter [Candidatus Omnitrophota bacterium]
MMEFALLIGAALVILSIAASKLSDKFAVPALVFFLFIGMLASIDGIGWIQFNDPLLAKQVGLIALVFIIFTGGFDTDLKDVRPVLIPGIVLSTFGVLLTAFIVGGSAVYFLHFSLLEGFLLGAVVSSTDAAAVFSILRSRQVGLKGSLRPLLEFESGSNDPMAVFLTLALISLIQGTVSPLQLVPQFLMEMGVGAVVGWFLARGCLEFIRWLKLEFGSLYPALTAAMVLFIYSAACLMSGSGILAVYVAGIVMGNADFMHKKTVKQFHEGLSWFMQIAMFLVLGLMMPLAAIPPVVGQGVLIAAVLMLVARPVSVFLSLFLFGFGFNRMGIIAWVGLRGAAPIILATFPLLAGLAQATEIFHIVFFVVLASIVIQGMSIPFVARLFKVDTPLGRRRKYPIEFERSEAIPATLTDLIVPYESLAAGKTIFELQVPAKALIVLISRDEKFIIPNGSTRIQGGDVLLVLAEDRDIAMLQSSLVCKKL